MWYPLKPITLLNIPAESAPMGKKFGEGKHFTCYTVEHSHLTKIIAKIPSPGGIDLQILQRFTLLLPPSGEFNAAN